MLIREGRLLVSDIPKLARPNPPLDTTDIPLIVTKGVEEDYIDISQCYLGIQHRHGVIKAKSVKVHSFVNDGLSLWTGGLDVDFMEIVHGLPFFYSPQNHSDCIQFVSMDYKTFKRNVNPNSNNRIGRMELLVVGKGAKDKGHVMLTETAIYSDFNLFAEGFICESRSTLPAFNANNLSNSTLGSPEYPIDANNISNLPIRIMGRKPGSPPSRNNVIHAYRGLKLELDAKARAGTEVRYYNRRWSKYQREDNWELAKRALELGI